MHKAFIFDMDGVLVDSEHAWGRFETEMLNRLLGEEVTKATGSTLGLGVKRIYEKAVVAGATVSEAELAKAYEVEAMKVYDVATLTPGTDKLVETLVANNFKLGLVTQSPTSWMNRVVPRFSWADKLEAKMCLYDRPDLKPKPEPDGYLEVLKQLGADAKQSIILEDTNLGIVSAKAAGAFVIGFRGCLVDGYIQEGADAYADSMEEVIDLVQNRI